jgi:hypothetical protein
MQFGHANLKLLSIWLVIPVILRLCLHLILFIIYSSNVVYVIDPLDALNVNLRKIVTAQEYHNFVFAKSVIKIVLPWRIIT